MCIVCTKEYNQNTTVLDCCMKVTEIPLLPNLTNLNWVIREFSLLSDNNVVQLYSHHIRFCI